MKKNDGGDLEGWEPAHAIVLALAVLIGGMFMGVLKRPPGSSWTGILTGPPGPCSEFWDEEKGLPLGFRIGEDK